MREEDQEPPPDALSAQQLLRQMPRELPAPALRDIGLDVSRGFCYASGDHIGFIGTAKADPLQQGQGGIHGQPRGDPSAPGAAYRDMRLLQLIHSRRRTWWTAETGHPIESAAEDMLGDFRDHGWPAILAAVDSPDVPPDPTTNWPRRFP